MTADLAVDVGGSGVRVAVLQDGHRVAERQWSLMSPLFSPALTAADYLTDDAAQEWLPTSIGRIIMGLSGLFGATGEPEQTLAFERLHAALGIESLTVCDDSVTAFFGALGMEPGVVTAVGTGIVTVGWAGPRAAGMDSGAFHRVDGWGAVGGDLGSGYWIGQQGILAALEMIDGRRPDSALRSTFLKRYRSAVGFSSVTVFGQPTKAYIADFAQDVLELAEGGDAVAEQIVDSAAEEIVRALTAAAEQTGLAAPTLCLTGNVAVSGGLLESRVRRRYAATGGQGRWRASAGSPLDGAVRLLGAPELARRLSRSPGRPGASSNPVQMLDVRSLG